METIIATDSETRDRVYRFRQELALGQDGRIGLLPSGYLVRTKVGLQDLLDPFAIVAAAIDRTTAKVVGAVRTNYLRESAVPLYPELYRLTELHASTWISSSVTSCWTMAPAFRCESATSPFHPAVLLAWSLYEVALRQRICHDFLDCADGEVPFFAHLGYRLVRGIVHPERGPSNLMRLDTYDWAYLAEVKSPFLQLARGVA